MKFKIGDTVEVVRLDNPLGFPFTKDFRKRHRGKVIEHSRFNAPFSYKVERKSGEQGWFNVRELKLIRRGAI